MDSRVNHDFTKHAYVHCAVLKSFMAKRAHEARDNQFLFQNIQDKIFEIFKMFRNNIKFTRAAFWINLKLAKEKIAPHPW